jgi:apolipoprotein N-acyltransferase
MRARNLLLVIAAGVASAAFSYLGTGLHPIWWLLWLAPVPVLAVAPRLRRSAAFLVASDAWLIGETNQWSYLTHEIGVPLKIVILFFVIPPVVLGFGVLLIRSVLRRG